MVQYKGRYYSIDELLDQLPEGNYYVRLKSHDQELASQPTVLKSELVKFITEDRKWNPDDVTLTLSERSFSPKKKELVKQD